MAAYLKQGLSESGYAVDVAREGIEGRHLASQGGYELVLLDLMLPGIDGLVLEAIRAKGNTAAGCGIVTALRQPVAELQPWVEQFNGLMDRMEGTYGDLRRSTPMSRMSCARR